MSGMTAEDRDLLARYREVKDRWERLTAEHATEVMNGTAWEITSKFREQRDEAEREYDALKAEAGEGQPGDPLCCQRYGRLHLPEFAVRGCRWYAELEVVCPRCHRPAVGWPLERGDRCSPPDWANCIRDPATVLAQISQQREGMSDEQHR
jgi:hypothetical protein